MSTSVTGEASSPRGRDLQELLEVVGDAAAGAAEREGRPDDRAGSRSRGRSPRPPRSVCAAPERGRSRPIFSIASLKAARSSALWMASRLAPIICDAVALEHAAFGERHRQVQAGLAAERRQQRVGPLALDDLRDDLGGERLDVGAVGELRVGHDRRRVGVDQDDLVALLAQRLAGLGAGVVELAGLADDDRAGADDQDLLDVGALGHRLLLPDSERVEGGGQRRIEQFEVLLGAREGHLVESALEQDQPDQRLVALDRHAGNRYTDCA